MTLAGAILDSLARQGRPAATPSDLYPVDQLHPLGPMATRALARLADIRPGERVLDLGCGIGGPSRLLAAEFGAAVVGIDLSGVFVACARTLTASVGPAERPVFVRADGLSLPFAEACFDIVWVQQSAMNIADKEAFYRAIAGSLKSGGRLALADCLSGPADGALHLPVPWAGRAEDSHLVDEPTLRAILGRAGFAEKTWQDVTADAIHWYRRLADRPSGTAPGAALVFGPDFPSMISNLRLDLEQGRVRLIEAVLEKGVGSR